MQEKKYYIVWEGKTPGVYDSWEECKAEVLGFPKAKYKSFKGISEEEAYRLFDEGPADPVATPRKSKVVQKRSPEIIPDAIAVDASTRHNPGPMEYQGVIVETGDVVFSSKVYPVGTNNIGEFLAIVHAMAWMKQHDYYVPIYSDSRNAISWVEKGVCKTKLERNKVTEELYQHLERAIKWIKSNDLSRYKIIKWKTREWGEIPADYGRK